MDDTLFRDYIRRVIIPLYPTISNECIIKDGKVIKGPVIFKTDSGPGRFKDNIEHVEFLEEMNNIGLKIILSLPNATSVHAELDQFFGPFKGYCRSRTLDHFSLKLKTKINDIKQDMSNKKTRSNTKDIDDINVMKENLNIIRDDPEKGDHHTDTDDHLSKIKCVVGLNNNDLSVMINGNDTDTLENRPFDRCFTKSKIKDAFYKVGFVPFTRECLKNPLVRHELDGISSESSIMRKLQSDYITTTHEVEKLGFNNVFTARLPKIKKSKMKTNTKDRFEELIKNNKAFSCSGMYIHVGTMLANSKEIIDAQKHVMKIKDKEKQNKHNTANELAQLKKDNAIHSYKLLKYENYKMKLQNWKHIAMWVLPFDGEKAPSKYNTLENIEKRLDKCKISWESYFEKYITEIDNVVTFKAKRLRNNNFEPLYEGEFNTTTVDEIKLAHV